MYMEERMITFICKKNHLFAPDQSIIQNGYMFKEECMRYIVLLFYMLQVEGRKCYFQL